MARVDLIVIGGGVIGCTVAWRAAQRGFGVTVLERDRFGGGATYAAAGMLAPIAEVDFGDRGRRALELGLDAAALWPAFADELAAASGTRSCLRHDGTLVLARDRDEAEALARLVDYRVGLGLEITPLLPSAARTLEPALAPTVRAAVEIPSERSVDPRWVCAALVSAARTAGATLREGETVATLERRDRRVVGVQLASGERLEADSVLVAAGAWSAAFGEVPIRPVKGQIMRLRDPDGPGLASRMLRFDGGYLVPRGDGRYVLGASVEERGFDQRVTAGAYYELLRDAAELLPGLLECEIEELHAGLRPGSPDNVPLVGAGGEPGLYWATGHYRNGILLAPLTAELALDALDGSAPLEALDPARFSRAASAT